MSSTRISPLRAVFCFVTAYVLTSGLNTVISLAYTVAMQVPTPEELGVRPLDDPAYQTTVPWHPAVTLLTYALATAILISRRISSPGRAILVGAIGLAATAAVDAVLWVLLLGDTRWGLPARDFYVGNQPWISLQYAAVLIAPVAVHGIRWFIGRSARA